MTNINGKYNYKYKQGFVEDYTQRLKEGHIFRQKLSRLKTL